MCILDLLVLCWGLLIVKLSNALHFLSKPKELPFLPTPCHAYFESKRLKDS